MTAAELITRVQTRLADTCEYEDEQILALLNEGQRLFCLLTLCLEEMRELELDPGQRWYRMLERWPDWIVPLRVRMQEVPASGGADWGTPMGDETVWAGAAHGAFTAAAPKLRPATLTDLTAEDSAWLQSEGVPTRYGMLGFDLLYLDKRPAQADLGRRLLITYARSSRTMTADSTPEIPEQDHIALDHWATLRVRLAEGGEALQGAVTSHLAKFLDIAKARAFSLRNRAIAQGYDTATPEWKMPDLSRLAIRRKEKKAA